MNRGLLQIPAKKFVFYRDQELNTNGCEGKMIKEDNPGI